jgi:DNA polymerase III subunit delta
MELKPQSVGDWVPGTCPDPLRGDAVRAVLLFGPDQGGVANFSRLAASQDGSYESIDMAGADIAEITATLTTGSLFGGATSVLLRGVTDQHFAKISSLLEMPFAPGARLVISAGDLKPASKLRKLFKTLEGGVSAPLYLLMDREISRMATGYFKQHNLTVDPAAAAMIGSFMSGDRSVAGQACEVVSLHCLGRGSARVEPRDLRAVLDDVDEEMGFAPLDHALKGDLRGASQGLAYRLNSGESFVGLLRAFSARLFRLRALLADGKSPARAVEAAKPPVFWKEKDHVISILSGLSLEKVDAMLHEIDRCEHRIIEGGIPAAAAMPFLLTHFATHKTWKASP